MKVVDFSKVWRPTSDSNIVMSQLLGDDGAYFIAKRTSGGCAQYQLFWMRDAATELFHPDMSVNLGYFVYQRDAKGEAETDFRGRFPRPSLTDPAARQRGVGVIQKLQGRRDKRARRIRDIRTGLFKTQAAVAHKQQFSVHQWNDVIRHDSRVGTTPLLRPVVDILYPVALENLRFADTPVAPMGTEYYSDCGREDAAGMARDYARHFGQELLDACSALQHGVCACGGSGRVRVVDNDEACPDCTPDDGRVQAKDSAPLTDMERAMLVAIRDDQYHDAHGALSPVWSWSPCDTFAEKFPRSSAGGVMASLVKKGLAVVQADDPDDTVALLKDGLLAIATHPTLEVLLANGTVWVSTDGSEYVGRAADGTEVNLGYDFEKDATERYLVAHPTPDTW